MTATSSGEPDFSRQAASPALVPYLDALRDQRWEELSKLLAGIGDPADLSYVVSLVATTELHQYLQGLGTAATTLELAVLARCEVTRAWEARGTGRAAETNEWQWRGFREGLVKSERILTRLLAEEPGTALAWEVRIITSRGLELGQGETRRRYDRLAAIVAHHRIGQLNLLTQLLPKWSGSWEAAHAFARECTQASPPGSINGELVAICHLEQAAETNDFTLARQASVAAGLMEAAHHSVLHKEFGRPYGWVKALGTFAFLFCAAGEHAAAAPFFRAMDGFGNENAWHHTAGDPVRNFVRDRDRALAKG